MWTALIIYVQETRASWTRLSQALLRLFRGRARRAAASEGRLRVAVDAEQGERRSHRVRSCWIRVQSRRLAEGWLAAPAAASFLLALRTGVERHFAQEAAYTLL